ncbi:putative leader peptide [Streptomyces sp. NPDC047525]|uniref:putative leader peptide n=1 Tax=Streptomyces sp. NPDC047525 TaxID=3155264 RepID=UPI0033DF83D5
MRSADPDVADPPVQMSSVPAPGERGALSAPRQCRIDPARHRSLPCEQPEVSAPSAVRDPALSSEELIDMRRLTQRRHIDLGRLAGAFCRR